MIFAGICAGGKGERFGGDVPKQFLMLNGKPMLVWSAEAFLRYGETDKIFVAVSGEYIDYCRGLFKGESRISVIKGGAARAETVALLAEKAAETGGDSDIMATHDAARPFVSADTIRRCIKAAEEWGASGAALPSADTVLQSRNGFAEEAPPREEMFLAQTPQCFKLGIFKRAWNKLSEQERLAATDVCGMLCRAGEKVKLVRGEDKCFKITEKGDLERALAYIKASG